MKKRSITVGSDSSEEEQFNSRLLRTKSKKLDIDSSDDIFASQASLDNLIQSSCSLSSTHGLSQLLDHISSPSQDLDCGYEANSNDLQQPPDVDRGTFEIDCQPTNTFGDSDYLDELGPLSSSRLLSNLSMIVSALDDDEDILDQAVDIILKNKKLQTKIVDSLAKNTRKSMREALVKSKLTENKKDREYLLGVHPLGLCREFQKHQGHVFDMFSKILFGVADPESIFKSKFLLNNMCLIYATVARVVNRNAIGYFLLLGIVARDGGLHEENFKIFPMFPNIRTVQRYDDILAANSQRRLEQKLCEEKAYFYSIKAYRDEMNNPNVALDADRLKVLREELKLLEDWSPSFVSTVWDNLNVRSGHRIERARDKWTDTNKDWMLSIHMTDRISVNHLNNTGGAVKRPDDLCIEDFCLSDKEKEFLFCSLVTMFSHSLLQRYPELFKSLKSAISDHIPHQFQAEMEKKTEEFTGVIYEKSECKTEELIEMLKEYQKEMVHVDPDSGRAFLRRQLSGDQKTEKNTYYSILSKSDESSLEERLAFITPAHEYFHQLMCMADISSELFRDNTKGLSGGAFDLATLLGRKKAKFSKGKDDIDSMKDFIVLKGEGRFDHYFLHKYGFDPSKDNTPALMKNADKSVKAAYLHGLVKDALYDLQPLFRECSGDMPDLLDFPVKRCSNTSKFTKPVLNEMHSLSATIIGATASQVYVPSTSNFKDYLLEITSKARSGTRVNKAFQCSKCGFKSNFKTVVLAHIKTCISGLKDLVQQRNLDSDLNNDYFWNFKNCEFLMDSIFMISLNFERHGNGLGMFIVSKFMLPFMHKLGHSNYSNTVHRFISRVISCSTEREGMKLIHERFSNKHGRVGGNIFKDRRVEFRIRVVKRLISNLGPHKNTKNIQKVNAVTDIKERLFHHARKSHGVVIRSGKHKRRRDVEDFKILVNSLTKNNAHIFTPGREYGSLKYPEDITRLYNEASFYRWLSLKNKEFSNAVRSASADEAFPLG